MSREIWYTLAVGGFVFCEGGREKALREFAQRDGFTGDVRRAPESLANMVGDALDREDSPAALARHTVALQRVARHCWDDVE